MQPDADIIIIGGGVIGLTLALGLAQNTTFSIKLFESRIKAQYTPANRFSAISPASRCLFERLAVWPKIQQITAFSKMHVWQAGSNASIDFNSADLKVPALGYIVGNAMIEAALLAALEETAQVQIVYGASPTALFFENNTVQVSTALGQHVAKLVVGADGACSKARALAGFSQASHDYQQTALVTTVKTALPHQQTAWQCFLPKGPLAFLPLSSPEASSIVWSTSPAEADRLLQLDEATFAEELERAFESRLGKILTVNARGAFPLIKRHANTYVKAGFVLIGDAAHSIHPLAGQGMNLGLGDVVKLIEVITEALDQRREFASFHTLRRYERARKTANNLMLNAMDFFRYVPSHPNRLLRASWQVGLKSANQLTFVKRLCLGMLS